MLNFIFPTKVPLELAWVDEFIKNVKEYIFVRTEDCLLIKRPNNAVKLNKTGAQILKFLLDGGKVKELYKKVHTDKEKLAELIQFFRAVKAQLEGKIDPLFPPPAVELIPFDMRFSHYPVLSEIALTYRCNLSCEFCYAGCNQTTNPIGTSEELNYHQIKKVLDKLYFDAKVPSVSFTGGEPTIVPELFKLIRYAKKLGMRVNLITNGTLITKQFAKRLKRAGLDSAQLSLEGIQAKTHNRIVGANVFEKTLAAYHYLSNLDIHTHTNTTICQENLAELINFPAFVKKALGAKRFSMNLLIPTGSATKNEILLVKYQDIGKHLEQVITESEKHEIEFMWYSPVPMCMFNSIVHGLGNKGCSACDGLISIAPNGDVLPCASYDQSIGKFLKEDFNNLWQSRQALLFREKGLAHEVCKACEHFEICNGACPLYWRDCGYQELLAIKGAA